MHERVQTVKTLRKTRKSVHIVKKAKQKDAIKTLRQTSKRVTSFRTRKSVQYKH